MLEIEREYYRTNLKDWKASHQGRFVLVRDRELVGVFNTHDEAISEGARRFGMTPFLIRQVSDNAEKEIAIPALTLGLLRAHPAISSPPSHD